MYLPSKDQVICNTSEIQTYIQSTRVKKVIMWYVLNLAYVGIVCFLFNKETMFWFVC